MFELKTIAVIDDGCFSAFLFHGRPFAVTCERTFADGQPVIKGGVWRCVRGFFNRGGYPTYEIIIPGHSLVKFHRGSLETDSQACVLVAESFAAIDGKVAIRDSKTGFEEFMRLAGDVKEFHLMVTGR